MSCTLCFRCSLPEDKQKRPCLECKECEESVHADCLSGGGTPGNLVGDVFFDFTCDRCSDTGEDVVVRDRIPWLYVVALVLNHLSKKNAGISNNGYFHWKAHLGSFMIDHWETLFDPSYKRKKNFCGTFSGLLSQWNGVFFQSGLETLKETGWWKMIDGFSPALIQYLYEQFSQWKQQDRKNASLVAADKMLQHKILKDILSPLGFEHLIVEPTEQRDREDEERRSGPAENEPSGSPRSEVKSPKSEIRSEASSQSYRGEPTNVDVDDCFSNYLMDCDDDQFMTNFDDFLIDFDEPKDDFHNQQEPPLFVNNNTNIEKMFKSDDVLNIFDKQISHKQKTSNNLENDDPKRIKLKYSESDLPPAVKGLLSDSASTELMPWKSSQSSDAYSKTESRFVTEYTEFQMLSKLNIANRKSYSTKLDKKLIRLRNKLALRRLKRKKHISLFNLDALVSNNIGDSMRDTLSGGNRILDQFQHSNSTVAGFSKVNCHFRLVGSAEVAPFISPYSGKLLKPYIWRDTNINPLWLTLMQELKSKANKNNHEWKEPPRASLDYCYVRPQHIASINNLCDQFFWPGIDLSDTLLYPEFSCVVLYKKIIVGFAFLVPDVSCNEAYLSFLFTRPEWRKCGIATFMLYHLTQTCVDKDITMHVSASNPALFLYQRFGFKIEEFLQEFYEKYFPPESKECKHAFFLRLHRS